MAINRDNDVAERSGWLASAGPVKCAFVGALYAVLGTFPVAAFVALVFRFPVPMVGYMSGMRALMASPIAVLFFLLIGGFPVLGLLGGIACWRVYVRGEERSYRNKHREILVFAAAIDFAAVVLLAVWDKIYGPW